MRDRCDLLWGRVAVSAGRGGCPVLPDAGLFHLLDLGDRAHSVVKVAFVIGMIGGPLFALIDAAVRYSLLGIGGGTVAYLIDRSGSRKRET